MGRPKNLLNDKERASQCVVTKSIVSYKIPLGDEAAKIGHFVDSTVYNNTITFRFATKKKEDNALRFEILEQPFILSFEE